LDHRRNGKATRSPARPRQFDKMPAARYGRAIGIAKGAGKRMSGFRMRSLVLAAACGSLLSGASASAEATLTVGKADANASPILPVNVGDQLGIFARHGLQVKIADFTGGSKLVQAMTGGSIDIGVAAGPLMALTAKGAPIIAICNDAPPIPFIGIAVPWDSPVRSVDGLKGKLIGISSAGSLTDWLAQELARVHGWGPQGVTSVAIGNGAAGAFAAFRTHAIDADISVTSNIFNWEEKKEARLLAPVSSYVGNIAAGTIFATKALVASRPEDIRSFLAAWLETIDTMRKHKDETVKIESGLTGYSPAVMSREYDLTIGMFSADGKFDAESLANLKRSFVDLKLVDAPPDMAQLYTEAFLPK
jgi:NitT/TauT family transport system substrate-binding protein